MKKILTTLLISLLVLGFCFANGGSEAAAPAAAAPAAESHIPTGNPPAGKVHIVFWTNMSGDSEVCTEDAAKALTEMQEG